jgi:predicted dehydrogenase
MGRCMTDNLKVPEGRFLVVGCGSIGKRHLGNLLKIGVKDILAFDPVETRRNEIRNDFGVEVVHDFESALEDGVRHVLICSPTSLHLAQSITAARSGCNLFIEKPVSDRLDGVEGLIREVGKRRLQSLVGCNFRFHPGLIKVSALLGANVIGNVVSARAQFGQYLPDWHPLEDYRTGYSARKKLGGGVVLDRVHEIDYIQWLLGEAESVTAMISRRSHLEIDTEDIAEILIGFKNGAVGSIHLDYVRRTYDCSLEIIGDEGTIQWCYQDNRVRWYVAEEKAWHELSWPKYDGNDMYVEEMKHFIKMLNNEEPSQSDVQNACRVLKIAMAAKRSTEEKKTIWL